MRLEPDLLSRARGEYLEMPGLCLTVKQAQRLWGLDAATCSRVLSGLVKDEFLRRRPDGSYVRSMAGSERHSA
jgi:Fic family protein